MRFSMDGHDNMHRGQADHGLVSADGPKCQMLQMSDPKRIEELMGKEAGEEAKRKSVRSHVGKS